MTYAEMLKELNIDINSEVKACILINGTSESCQIKSAGNCLDIIKLFTVDLEEALQEIKKKAILQLAKDVIVDIEEEKQEE